MKLHLPHLFRKSMLTGLGAFTLFPTTMTSGSCIGGVSLLWLSSQTTHAEESTVFKTDGNVCISDQTLENYDSTLVNSNDTLVVSASTNINNLNGDEGSHVVITNNASVYLRNTDETTANTLNGSLTGETGTIIDIGGGNGTLIVNGALQAYSLNVNAGTLVANGGVVIDSELTVASKAVFQLGADQSMKLGRGTIAGKLSGDEDSTLIVTDLVSIGDSSGGSIVDVALKMSGGTMNLSNGEKSVLNVTSLQGDSQSIITGSTAGTDITGVAILNVGNKAESCFEGSMRGCGTLTTAVGSKFTMNNVSTEGNWNVSNNGDMLLDVTQSGNLTLGILTLAANSSTIIRYNSDTAPENMLNLQRLAVDKTAQLTLELTGKKTLEAKDYIIGSVDAITETDKLPITLIGSPLLFIDTAESYIFVDANGNIIFHAAANEAMAALAGSTTAALGLALSGDVERQLRTIRNRAAMGGYSTSAVVPTGKGTHPAEPHKYFAWVNAEGNRAEQEADGTAAGYTLTSWGGTVGAGVQVTPQLTLGMALTAMYGDLQSNSQSSLDGDMDTTYLSAFARHTSGAWSHCIIGTLGTMEADYTRTAMGYTNQGDTDGTALGLMYELSREFALSPRRSISPLFNISYRHTEVDSYSENGTGATLNVGKQSLDTVSLGLGARYAAVVGQQTLNRACSFEARALARYDLGDTQSNTTVGFINHATRAAAESAETGAFGVELGAGLSVPVGAGSFFADGAVELRSDYTNVNATVGYKVEF